MIQDQTEVAHVQGEILALEWAIDRWQSGEALKERNGEIASLRTRLHEVRSSYLAEKDEYEHGWERDLPMSHIQWTTVPGSAVGTDRSTWPRADHLRIPIRMAISQAKTTMVEYHVAQCEQDLAITLTEGQAISLARIILVQQGKMPPAGIPDTPPAYPRARLQELQEDLNYLVRHCDPAIEVSHLQGELGEAQARLIELTGGDSA